MIASSAANHINFVTTKSTLGAEIYFKGKFTAGEDALINGRLDGIVELKANQLEIGVSGCVHAAIFAKRVLVSGEVIGDIHASEEVIVTGSGKVTGDIYAADVSIEEGACIKGAIGMQAMMSESTEIQNTAHSRFSFLFYEKYESEPDLSEPDHSNKIIHLNLHSAYKNKEESYMGPSVHLQGELIAKEDVRLDGSLDGVIYLQENSLVVGVDSRIKANVIVQSLILEGEVQGEVTVSSLLVINPSGRVIGNIHAPCMRTEKGAMVMGCVTMEAQDLEQAYARVQEEVKKVELTEERNTSVVKKKSWFKLRGRVD